MRQEVLQDARVVSGVRVDAASAYGVFDLFFAVSSVYLHTGVRTSASPQESPSGVSEVMYVARAGKTYLLGRFINLALNSSTSPILCQSILSCFSLTKPHRVGSSRPSHLPSKGKNEVRFRPSGAQMCSCRYDSYDWPSMRVGRIKASHLYRKLPASEHAQRLRRRGSYSALLPYSYEEPASKVKGVFIRCSCAH